MPDDRLAQILAAAELCFVRRGFHATTVPDIAAEAGISVGLLYRYLGGKDDLVVALVADYVARLQTAIEQAETLEAALSVLFDSEPTRGDRSEPDAGEGRGDTLLVEVYAEALRNDRVGEHVREATARVTVALADRIRQAQRAGEADPGLDPDATATVVLALGDGLAVHVALADEVVPRLDAAVADALRRLLAPR